MADWFSGWNESISEEQSLHVRWLLNPLDEPIKNVKLIVSGGVLTQIVRMPDSTSANALPVAIIPPLVNAHTHLEFSLLTEPLQPAFPFTDWVRSVIACRRHPVEQGHTGVAIRAGLQECKTGGTSAVGEIRTSESPLLLADPEITVVAFREVIGLDPGRIAQQMTLTDQHRTSCEGSTVIPGISPHASYSVHPELLKALVEYAADYQMPVAMHLAETLDEVELLQEGTGRFRTFLQDLGIWKPGDFPGHRSTIDYLQQLAGVPRSLVIHGNYLNDRELDFLSQHEGMTLVYCPRTHRFFGHQKHPWRRLMDAGGRVVLGTDSRASNPDLNVWDELQFVARQAIDLPVATLLSLATTASANALGLLASHFRITESSPLSGLLIPCESGTHRELEVWARADSTRPRFRMRNGVVHPIGIPGL